IAVTERVPPRVQHLLVETQDALARNVCRRRSERGEPIINAGAFRVADTRQQMPQRKGIWFLRLMQHSFQQENSFLRRRFYKIKLGQSVSKGRGGAFEIGSPRPDPG